MGHLFVGFDSEIEILRYFAQHSTQGSSAGLTVIGVVYLHSVELELIGIVGKHIPVRYIQRVNRAFPVGKRIAARTNL